MTLTRRSFAASIGGAAFAYQSAAPRPNILWLTSEDIGPQIGAYGDRYANTPNLDRFTAGGVRYDYCWSNAPVCAPARTAIISGMYPTSTGSEHMRSLVPLPPDIKMFPQYLREAGYYCSNNAKEDYNLEKPGQVWDDSSYKGHWRNRAAGQPFFSVFNFGITHESQVLRRRPNLTHDPAAARLPAYYPDTLEVRRDIAQYYDNITTMDGQFAKILGQLEADGLAEDTIVFFYGDNGICLPRGKRMPYNSGLIVPLMVQVPEKYRKLAPAGFKAGGRSDRLVSFVDLAPTVLSLAGLAPPRHMQGRPFLGNHLTPDPGYLFGFRGRMDERYDLMRATRDRRYVYVRNYMPHRVYGERVVFQWQQPSMQEWDRLHQEGKLNAAQSYFWETKPHEELYDLTSDGDEVKNLAGSPAHQATLLRMRRAQDEWMRDVRDVGLLPEPEMHARAKGAAPYTVGHDPKQYAYDSVKRAATMAASVKAGDAPQVAKLLSGTDSAARYWGATGLLIRKQEGVAKGAEALGKALDDDSVSVRIAAAEALGRYGTPEEQPRAMRVLLDLSPLPKNGPYVSMLALNALDHLPLELLRSVRAEIQAIDTGPDVGVMAAVRAGGGGAMAAPRIPNDGSTFDMFGGSGLESVASRTGGGSKNLKLTILSRLGS